MAGYGHGSVTGIDERTLGRIDLLLFDADYPDAEAAIEDAWRVALLAAEPRLRDARERVRAEAVRVANERRDPRAAAVPHVGLVHRLALGAALVLAVVATGLVVTAARPPLTLDITMLPAGLAAAASVSLLWWLEPRRANGSLWGSRAPSVLHLVCGCLWLLAGAVAVLGRWGEVDGAHPLGATTGLTLLGLAGAAALLLWWRARAADRSGRQSGTARLTGDLIDPHDIDEVLSELDAWWRATGPQALADNGDRVRRVRLEVLARLRHAGIIAERDERMLRAEPAPPRWRERRA